MISPAMRESREWTPKAASWTDVSSRRPPTLCSGCTPSRWAGTTTRAAGTGTTYSTSSPLSSSVVVYPRTMASRRGSAGAVSHGSHGAGHRPAGASPWVQRDRHPTSGISMGQSRRRAIRATTGRGAISASSRPSIGRGDTRWMPQATPHDCGGTLRVPEDVEGDDSGLVNASPWLGATPPPGHRGARR